MSGKPRVPDRNRDPSRADDQDEDDQRPGVRYPSLRAALQKIKQPTRPSGNDAKAKHEAIKAQLAAVEQEIVALNKQLEQSSRGGAELKVKRDAIFKVLNELKAQRTAKEAEREAISREQEHAQNMLKTLRKKKDEVEARLGTFRSAEKIDAEIKTLESKLNSAQSVREEQSIFGEIRNLTRSKANLRELTDAQTAVADQDAVFKAVSARMGEKLGEIRVIYTEENKHRDALRALEGPKDSKAADKTTPLRKQIQDLWTKKKALFDERNNVSKQFEESVKRYAEEQKEYEAKIQEEKARVQAQIEEIKKREDDELKKLSEELAQINPFLEKIATADNLVLYLEAVANRLNPDSSAAEAAAARAAAAAAERNAALEKPGLKLLGKEEDLSGLFGGLASSKTKKSRKAEKKSDAPKDETVSHPIEKFAAFTVVSVDVPLFASQIPKAIEAIKSKRNEWASWTAPAAKVEAAAPSEAAPAEAASSSA